MIPYFFQLFKVFFLVLFIVFFAMVGCLGLENTFYFLFEFYQNTQAFIKIAFQYLFSLFL